MLENKKIAVVVPCFREENQISLVISTMPDFVDRIVVVDDCSNDRTTEVILSYASESQSQVEIKQFPDAIIPNKYNEADILFREMEMAEIVNFTPQEVIETYGNLSRVVLIRHLSNGGVGAAIASGYKWCKDHNIDCSAVMAGDGQMDPAELESICRPIVEEKADYVKGNRLSHPFARVVMPSIRRRGNMILSMLTKIATGYWRLSDTQTGYTAINLRTLRKLELWDIYPRYGMPNDMLIKLNICKAKVKEVPIKPIYRVGEQSKLKVGVVAPKIAFLLLRGFFKRVLTRYLWQDFHPIFFFYAVTAFLSLLAVPYFIKIIHAFWAGIQLNYEPLLAFLFLSLFAIQSLGLALWLDMQDNDRLQE